MDKNTLIDACVELVTVNCRPFTMMEDSGFRRIVDPILEALNEQQHNTTIGRYNIQQRVQKEAQRIRDEIRADLKGRLICIKVDTATRLDRSIMGINVQICRDGQIILRNLATKELFSRHSASNLKTEINAVLAEYEILPSMVYSVTTDNASNMIKTVQLISDNVRSDDMGSDNVGNDDVSLEIDEDDQIQDMNHDVLSEVLEIVDDKEWSEVLKNLPDQMKQDQVLGLRCAAHTLQLAVRDVLVQVDIANVLNEARKTCKKLRTPTSVGLLRTLGRSKPVIDCPTRWHSTLEMVDSVLKLRDVCKEVVTEDRNREKIHLSDSEWETLEQISYAFGPAKIATKSLQSEQLLVGDFLAAWLRCKYDTRAIGSTFAQSLHFAMEQLFDSPAITSALYLDSRWHVILSPNQRRIAEDHLMQVWKKLQALNHDSTMEALRITSHSNDGGSSPIEVDEDPLDRLLRRRDQVLAVEAAAHQQRDIKALIRAFINTPRQPRTSNLLKYWETRKTSDPELYQLATTVLSVPMTQVSDERLFSHLKYLLNYLRSRLGSQLVNDILLVRCNRLFQRKEM